MMTALKPDIVSESIDIFVGPVFTFRTPVTSDKDYCLAEVRMPASVTVPLHSHADRETFYIQSGQIEAYLTDQWQTLRPGNVFDVTGGAKHALRNSFDTDVTFLMVTTMKMAQFFIDVGRQAGEGLPPPTPADMQHFLEVSKHYGYWMGNETDNAEIGII